MEYWLADTTGPPRDLAHSMLGVSGLVVLGMAMT